MKLLIVEDNYQMRRLIKNLVQDLATSITECGDGREAIADYKQSQPDWVLMDIVMPGVDGLAATREIRAVYPDAKIVIVTNHNDARFRNAAREAGASFFVSKEDLQAVRAILLKEKSATSRAL
jgi:CheY-like chemotaxis protein